MPFEETFVAHLRDSGEEVPFPVVWPDEEAAARAWRWDAEHSPFPLTPLSQEFSRGPAGPAVAAESLGAPAPPPMPSVIANGYRYAGGAGGYGSDAPAYLKTVSELAPRVDQLWEQGWRQEIEDRGRSIASFDYGGLDLRELVERLESMVDGVRENMVLMFRAAHLVSFSRNRLVQFCQAYIGEAAESLVTDLLQGTQTESFEAGAAMWDVAQVLIQHPPALEALRTRPDGGGLQSLANFEGGAEFQQAFAAWLGRYGNRNGSFGELAEPTWREDEKVPLSMVLQYADAPDPRTGRQRAQATRAHLQADFEKRLGSSQEVAALHALLADAGPYLAVRESRDHAIVMAFTAIRVPALEIGRRLAAQRTIAAADDVFFLGFAELREAASTKGRDFTDLAAQRRREYEYWRSVAPPPTLGGEAGRDSRADSLIRGVAASPGVVTAPARVLLSLADAHTLQRGEIIIARGTTPAWTPLFGTAAAVVTEGGGMLSHCAIVAREYGIPAVVGANQATLRIRDGASITVDGNKGRVILDAPG